MPHGGLKDRPKKQMQDLIDMTTTTAKISVLVIRIEVTDMWDM